METTVPNHHASYPGFSGVGGALAALTMSVGRHEVATLVADLTHLGPDDCVIDIGCGPGNAARLAAARGATAVGVDPAPVMLGLARRLTRSQRVSFVEGTAESLPAETASATIVWTLASVHHWKDLDAGLAEVRRVLRPGGQFVAVETRTQPGANGLASHGWTDEQAAEFVERCRAGGFTNPRVEQHHADRRMRQVVLATT